MTAESLFSVGDVEDQIRVILSRIQSLDYVRFRCHHVILYRHDPSTRLLEPIFVRPERAYVDLKPVPAAPDLGAYIASLAFKSEETTYSLKPLDDPRLCDDAKDLIRSYGFQGALIACPLPPRSEPDLLFSDEPIGALVLCANQNLEGPDPEAEVRLYLEGELVRLTFLLVLREWALGPRRCGQVRTIDTRPFSELASHRYTRGNRAKARTPTIGRPSRESLPLARS